MANKSREQRLARTLTRSTGVSYQTVLNLLRQITGLADLPSELHETADPERVLAILRHAASSDGQPRIPTNSHPPERPEPTDGAPGLPADHGKADGAVPPLPLFSHS